MRIRLGYGLGPLCIHVQYWNLGTLEELNSRYILFYIKRFPH